MRAVTALALACAIRTDTGPVRAARCPTCSCARRSRPAASDNVTAVVADAVAVDAAVPWVR